MSGTGTRMTLKNKMESEKPWAILRMSRVAYEAGKPWKRGSLSKAKFEELLRLIPDELISEMRDQATADVLVESIFGKHED